MAASALERRLDRIEQTQTEALLKLATLIGKVDVMHESVADLAAEVGHVPEVDARDGRKTVTTRLHQLESNVTPAVLDASMERVLTRRHAAVVKAWQVRVTLGGVVVGTALATLRFFGVGA